MQLFGETAYEQMGKAVDFYRHDDNWQNRMILGDSLLVMNSLLEKEGMRGQVQMVYIDPPYGIKFGSNWQVSTRKRDVKDNKIDDLVRQPEQIKAFRDTWELGVHSYLSYLRDRLIAARELLTESGSCFVQISDENLHLVRNILDEVFGSENFLCQITFTKASGGLQSANRVGVITDYIVWFAKNQDSVKYRAIYEKKLDAVSSGYTKIELKDGTRRTMTKEEKATGRMPEGSRPYSTVLMTKPGPGSGRTKENHRNQSCRGYGECYPLCHLLR
jgi:adenine-specific DNA-methyltransferase